MIEASYHRDETHKKIFQLESFFQGQENVAQLLNTNDPTVRFNLPFPSILSPNRIPLNKNEFTFQGREGIMDLLYWLG